MGGEGVGWAISDSTFDRLTSPTPAGRGVGRWWIPSISLPAVDFIGCRYAGISKGGGTNTAPLLRRLGLPPPGLAPPPLRPEAVSKALLLRRRISLLAAVPGWLNGDRGLSSPPPPPTTLPSSPITLPPVPLTLPPPPSTLPPSFNAFCCAAQSITFNFLSFPTLKRETRVRKEK